MDVFSLDFQAVICIFIGMYFCYHAPNSLGGHSGQFIDHLSHQGTEDSVLMPTFQGLGAWARMC